MPVLTIKEINKIIKQKTAKYDPDDGIDLGGEYVHDEKTGETIFVEDDECFNEDGINLLDVFYTRVRGMNIFLQVAKTRKHEVAVFELSSNFYPLIDNPSKYVEVLNFNPRRRPFLVPKDNNYTNTTFWVKTTKNRELRIKLTPDLPLAEWDKMNGHEPKYGVLRAIRLEKFVEGTTNTLRDLPFPFSKKPRWPNKNKTIKENIELC